MPSIVCAFLRYLDDVLARMHASMGAISTLKNANGINLAVERSGASGAEDKNSKKLLQMHNDENV